MALLLSQPQAAADAARKALAQWYCVVAPSLFPFIALMPLLTCDAALRGYEALFGGIMGRAFGLPGAAASAMAVGMLAGSPAGCMAARRAAAGAGMDGGQLERLAAACCGMSPGFLISGVGAGMLGSAAMGHVLLRSQIVAQLLLLALPAGSGDTLIAETQGVSGDGLGGAVRSVLLVAGYMTLFAALAAALGEWVGAHAGRAVLTIMDVTSGARIVSAYGMAPIAKLTLLSGLTTFGGVCVCAQNLAALSGCGIRPGPFVARRCVAAALAALVTWTQLARPWEGVRAAFSAHDPLKFACLFAALMALHAVWRLRKIYF